MEETKCLLSKTKKLISWTQDLRNDGKDTKTNLVSNNTFVGLEGLDHSKDVAKDTDERLRLLIDQVQNVFAKESLTARYDAATKIQSTWRVYHARQLMRNLVASVYQSYHDPTTGIKYYYNSVTKTTQWTKPRALGDRDLDLADKAKHTTQPLARKALSEEEAAIMVQRQFRRKRGFKALLELCRSVYERHYDEDSQLYYYYNTRTHETTWDKPLLLRNAKADVYSPRTKLQLMNKNPSFMPESSTTIRRKIAWTEESAAIRLQCVFRARRAQRELETKILEQFRRVKDEESGDYFYVNLLTGSTLWTLPAFKNASRLAIKDYE